MDMVVSMKNLIKNPNKYLIISHEILSYPIESWMFLGGSWVSSVPWALR